MRLRVMSFLLTILLVAAASSGASAATSPIQTASPAPAKPAASDPVSGKYEGVAKSQALGEIPLTVEIKNTGGKISGKIDTPNGPADITDGSYADGKLTLKFNAGGNEGNVNAQMKDDKITGEWGIGGQTMGTIELKKITGTTTADATKDVTKPAASDPISGEWEAAAEAQGQNVLFTLHLKLEGDKITGKSSSPQLGEANITKGSWVNDKLSLTLETPAGPIILNAMIKEGKLVGDYDYVSQLQGKWEAKKK